MALSPFAITRFFLWLRDPRRTHRRKHLLIDLIVIALCAVIAGANDWQQVVTFAQCRRAWLQTFLALPEGIPSHDTFERVFDRLDTQAFLACFQRWIESLAPALGLGQIAIDGKTLRGSKNGPKGWAPLHLVSAWATESHLSLGQVAVDAKSNEIAAIPRLLELLDLHGALVTIDAIGCQTAIAEAITGGGGDYVLVVKENQPHLLEDIQECLGNAIDTNYENVTHDHWASEDRGHGRHEKRSVFLIVNPEGLRNRDDWSHLNVVGMIRRERTVAGETSEEVHYFIGSRVMTAQRYGEALRDHWGIENNLHWQLDISFREDENRVQRRHGAENLALLRRLALCLLKRHPRNVSLANKRYTAALDTAFLEEILTSDAIQAKCDA